MEDNCDSACPSLGEADVRWIASLLSELSVMHGGLVPRRRVLFDRLATAINADQWLWARRFQDTATDEPRYAALLHAGFTPEGLEKIAATAAHPDFVTVDAKFRNAIAKSDRQVTLRLEDYADMDFWRASPMSKLAEQAGMRTVMGSARRLGEKTSASVVAFYRGHNAERFSLRDRLLVDIVLDGADWVHADDSLQESEAVNVADLPRQHMVLLSLLIHGNSRQEIAELMQLSLHTVNSYTKTLFKHFGVRSQTELMQQFIHGKANGELPAAPQLSD